MISKMVSQPRFNFISTFWIPQAARKLQRSFAPRRSMVRHCSCWRKSISWAPWTSNWGLLSRSVPRSTSSKRLKKARSQNALPSGLGLFLWLTQNGGKLTSPLSLGLGAIWLQEALNFPSSASHVACKFSSLFNCCWGSCGFGENCPIMICWGSWEGGAWTSSYCVFTGSYPLALSSQ